MDSVELLFKGSTNLQVLNTILNVAVIPLILTLISLRKEIGDTKTAIKDLHIYLLKTFVTKEDHKEDLDNVLKFKNNRR